MQLGYRLRRLLFAWFRIRTRGVKVMVFNPSGELLLIRNTYGDSRFFVLPGGGIGRRETATAAAAREVREEVGLKLRNLEALGSYSSAAEGKRDTIELFRGLADGDPVPDRREVEEAAFFPLEALPAATSAATLRRVAELAGAPRGPTW
jgi:ADP-ribose pyrophosphatase YjhB (NUDIX family)